MADTIEHDVGKLSERVAVLENQSLQLNSLITKLEATTDKLADVSSDLREFIVVHDHRLVQTEQKIATSDRDIQKFDDHLQTIQTLVNVIQKDMTTHIEREEKMFDSFDKRIGKADRRIDSIERWRWVIVGGTAVVVWILSNFEFVKFMITRGKT